MLNKVILTGRLTAQPALKTTQSGVSVVSFSLAVQRNYKDAQGSYPTDFITCVAWRNTAERETVDVTELPGGNDMDFESIEDGELPF